MVFSTLVNDYYELLKTNKYLITNFLMREIDNVNSDIIKIYFKDYELTTTTYKIEILQNNIKEIIKNIILKSKFIKGIHNL